MSKLIMSANFHEPSENKNQNTVEASSEINHKINPMSEYNDTSESNDINTSIYNNMDSSESDKTAHTDEQYAKCEKDIMFKNGENETDSYNQCNTQSEVYPDITTPKFYINSELEELIKKISDTLKKYELNSFADEADTILKNSCGEKFTISVVGEFSRGKSSFINKLIGRDLLPVANLPTTAMLTKIRYSENEEGITVVDGETSHKLPLKPDAWDEFIADAEYGNPSAIAYTNINSPILKHGIEIIDTPGAGDLDEGRSAVIGDALLGSDMAIITISALSPLSLSEKLFIEERLIAKQTPFLIIILTMLDRIDISQRCQVVDYVKSKLDMWGMENIPVFIPYYTDMPDNKFDNIIGMDKIINTINSWTRCSERKSVTEQILAVKIKSVLKSAIEHVNTRQLLANAQSESELKELISEKEKTLMQADKIWDEIKLEIIKCKDECYGDFLEKIEEYEKSLTEKMTFEMMHSSHLQRWWTEDFPYRLKIEMTNLSVAVENLVSKALSRDILHINSILAKDFGTNIIYTCEYVADKEIYTDFISTDNVDVKDMTKDRNMAQLGVAASSIATSILFGVLGLPTFIATIGLGTGGPMITEAIFKNKTEAQKVILRDEIKERIPQVIKNASSYSENRIKSIYHELTYEIEKKQESWVDSQKSAITAATNTREDNSDKCDTQKLLNILKAMCISIDNYT